MCIRDSVTTVAPGVLRTGSHVNAEFKGRHEAEFAWFAIGSGNPLLTTDALTAARQIVGATRGGDAQLVITLPARLMAALNGVAPDLVAAMTALGNRILPDPSPEADADMSKTGSESQSRLAPSPLTWLADEATTDNNEALRSAPAT